jgi:flagellar hook protein FlgE
VKSAENAYRYQKIEAAPRIEPGADFVRNELYKPEKEKQMPANMMYTAIAGLNTFNDALSVVSDNIANANTTGWKSNTVDFGDLVSGLIPTDSVNTTAQGVGSQILGITSDFGTGNEIQTGLWSDVMIQGNGFFCVQDSSGADYYTRDGSFQINSAGFLTDTHGNFVLDKGGAKIQTWDTAVNPSVPYSSYSIDKFGNLTGVDAQGNTTTIAQLQVATFNNPNGLIRDGANMYTLGASAGAAIVGTAGSGQAGQIISAALEGSNVDLTQQMVNLIDYQADYQANSKSIATGSTLLQTVVGLIPG